MLKSVLIGLGSIGLGYDLLDPFNNQFKTHAKALIAHTGFDFLAAIDNDEQKRELISLKYKIPAYKHISEDLANQIKSPDIFIVATPTDTHLEIIEQIFLHFSPKIILCEKPISYKLNEAEKILELCKKNSCKLYINYIRQAQPAALEVKDRILNNHIEGPLHVKAFYTKGLVHNGSHFIDLLQKWLGPIKDLKVENKNQQLPFGDGNPDLKVFFKNASAEVYSSLAQDVACNEIFLFAKNGVLEYKESGYKVEWIQRRNGESYQVERLFSGLEHYQMHVLNEIFKANRGLPANLTDGESALSTLKAILSVI